MSDKKNILIGITSSIASYKIYELIRLYKKNGFNVKVILTPNCLKFISPIIIETLTNNEVYVEQFAPRTNVEHINLVEWADIFVVAPISANTISKFAAGIADNLLTSVFCAYLTTKKPVLLAPAMNNNMYNNPIIQKNLNILKELNCVIIEPATGFLACGSENIGRLEDIELIYHKSLRQLLQNKNNNKIKILITSGGTKEKIDTVRYITNASSGKMGYSIALQAYYRGYDVYLITSVKYDKAPFEKSEVKSANDMLNEIKNHDFDYLIMAAAVCDFRAKNPSNEKLSKKNTGETLNLELVQNPDIVKETAQNKKQNQKIIGFCLADKDIIECAKNKLIDKNLDYIIANDVKTALNTDKNKVTIISKSGKIIDIDLDTKLNIAQKILEVVCD